MAEAEPPPKIAAVSGDRRSKIDPRDVDGPSPCVRGLNRLLAEARATLQVAAGLEVAVAAAAGGLAGVGVAAVGVGLVPFSVLLRDGLLGFIAVAALGAAAVVFRARWWPLRFDLVVAARIEAALRRRGLEVRDLVRSAVELRDSSIDQRVGRSRALCDAHVGRAVDVVRAAQAGQSLAGVALERAVPTLLSAAAAVLLLKT